MNIGEILPYFHVSSEDNMIKEYSVETNPKSRQEHTIIAVRNDIDLGEKSWFSSDSGNTGKSHGIIFENTNVLKTGISEENGIQVKGYEKQEASLPGLKAYSAGIYCGRNSFENDSWDRNIPSGLIIEFRGELFTTEDQGYYVIDEEAVWRYLVDMKTDGGTLKNVLDYLEGVPKLKRRTDKIYVDASLDNNVGFVDEKIKEREKDVYVAIIIDDKGKPTHYITTGDIRRILMKCE